MKKKVVFFLLRDSAKFSMRALFFPSFKATTVADMG